MVEQPMTTLQRYFSGLAEHTFEVKLGIVDPPLIDYLSGLLVRCVRTDQLHGVGTPRGRALRELGLMVKEAETRIGMARRRLYRCVGDFAMFWTGLFPESLRQSRSDADVDQFEAYCLHGKRSYLIASSIPPDNEDAPSAELLERLGVDFEMCAYGLREVRREWEEIDSPPPVTTARVIPGHCLAQRPRWSRNDGSPNHRIANPLTTGRPDDSCRSSGGCPAACHPTTTPESLGGDPAVM